MTNQEFFKIYEGKKVCCGLASHLWKGFVGRVKELSGNGSSLKVETIIVSECVSNNEPYGNKPGAITFWQAYELKVVDDEPLLSFAIPDNNYPCPNCKSLSCKGLDRLDCVNRGTK